MTRVEKWAKRAESAVIQISKILNIIGIIGVAALMLLITTDVLGRAFFGKPVTGAIDLSAYIMIVAVYCSVAYCAVKKGHVNIDLIASGYSPRVQIILDTITGFISLVVFSFMVWATTKQLLVSWTRGEKSYLLGTPAWPFRATLMIGIFMLCLVLLIDMIHLVVKVIRK